MQLEPTKNNQPQKGKANCRSYLRFGMLLGRHAPSILRQPLAQTNSSSGELGTRLCLPIRDKGRVGSGACKPHHRCPFSILSQQLTLCATEPASGSGLVRCEHERRALTGVVPIDAATDAHSYMVSGAVMRADGTRRVSSPNDKSSQRSGRGARSESERGQ